MIGDPSIYEAISFYTGGTYEPIHAVPWRTLQARIDNSPYDAYQFCWYMACFSGAKAEWAVIQRKNVMTNEAYWKRFLAWKEGRVREVRTVVVDSLATLDALHNSGVDLTRLLINEVPAFNAIVRVERALRERHDTGGEFDVAPVVARWRISATEKLLGDPEYLIWCPHLYEEYQAKGAVYCELIPGRCRREK